MHSLLIYGTVFQKPKPQTAPGRIFPQIPTVSSKLVIDRKKVYPIDMYYNGVDILSSATAEELEEMLEEHRKQKRSKEQKMA